MSEGKLNFSNSALVSIHDIMPETLPETETILQLLEDKGIQAVTLLIVPGRNWTKSDINLLKKLQVQGYTLAGHGWNHRCYQKKSLRHKIHSALLSRMVAEHLSLSRGQIINTIQRCFTWFQENDLQSPNLYVPPAWVLGSITRKDLEAIPFNMYETLTGVYHSNFSSYLRLPLVGFEADTRLRIGVLKVLNAFNSWFNGFTKRALRIAIHPYDLRYGLADDLKKLLAYNFTYINYSDLGFKHSAE